MRILFGLVLLPLSLSIIGCDFEKILSQSEKIEQLEDKVNDLQTRFDKVEKEWNETLFERLAQKLEGIVDLTTESIQVFDPERQLYLVRASVSPHLTGVRVSGRIINGLSIDYGNAKFKITMAGQSNEFSINRISGGNSTSFKVYLPDVPKEKTNMAKIEYVSGSFWYATR